MKIILKLILAIVLIAVLATVLVPVGYFTWRAGQPMELPQFNSLTYYQYLHWRKMALHQMAVDYRAAHPNAPMGGGLDMCYQNETGATILKGMFAAFYTLAGVFPSLEKYVTPADRQYIPQGTTLATFLPNWWLTYEKAVWDTAAYVPHTSVVYCRLQPFVPTPEQFQELDD